MKTKNTVVLALLILFISCRGRQRFEVSIDFPGVCKKKGCDTEIILEDDGTAFFRERANFRSGNEIPFPEIDGAKPVNIQLFIYIDSIMKFIARGEIGKHMVLMPLPINGSRIAGDLKRPRFGHSQIFHSSGKVIISGGLKRVVEKGEVLEGDMEKAIELYDVYTHKSRLFKGVLKYGRFFHESYLLEDGRILLSTGERVSFPEIINTEKETIETVNCRGRNFVYIGEMLLYYEYGGVSHIFDIKKGKTIATNSSGTEDAGRPVFHYGRRLFLPGKDAHYFDLPYLVRYPLKRNIETRIEQENFTHTTVADVIYFIDRSKGDDSIYSLFPGLSVIERAPFRSLQLKAGRVISSIRDFLVITGSAFELISVRDSGAQVFPLLNERSFHSATEIEYGVFILSGGLSRCGVIHSTIELFQTGVSEI